MVVFYRTVLPDESENRTFRYGERKVVNDLLLPKLLIGFGMVSIFITYPLADCKYRTGPMILTKLSIIQHTISALIRFDA